MKLSRIDTWLKMIVLFKLKIPNSKLNPKRDVGISSEINYICHLKYSFKDLFSFVYTYVYRYNSILQKFEVPGSNHE